MESKYTDYVKMRHFIRILQILHYNALKMW